MTRRVLPLLAATAVATLVPAGTAGADPVDRVLAGTLVGTYAFTACPPGSAGTDFCLADHLTGRLRPLGRVTGEFTVVIHTGAFGPDGCGPVDKFGSFTAADGSTLKVNATGTYCSTSSIAAYVLAVTGGTGRLAGATGAGTWTVPPPAVTTPTGGSGTERLDGTLTTG